MTINEALVLVQVIKERKAELLRLRSEVSTKDVYFERDKAVEPLYDVKKVDAKIVQLQSCLVNASYCIKVANAITHIYLGVDVDQLLSAIE